MERRLVAILAADMVGYSRLMEVDEEGTISRQKIHRSELIDPAIAEHDGRIVKTTGDVLLVEFPSVVDAVRCAVAIQRGFAAHNGEHSEEPVHVRIGLHTGEAIRDADKFFGLTVILTARIAAQAGGDEILVSADLKAACKESDEFAFGAGTETQLKGFADAHTLHRVDWGAAGS